ncbi:hypothetical protein BN2476_1640010 [Paraburkholderia piptadeniae]|uniref:Uncharacterized protein n=1 Tax=Paraburkholderia piptadeniae TaxID=1701573 RepID=A0A1N7SX98_9BURK|nr:hypothetical protein BN2476_1640010 [Paraburkholderia piptadeniae]
MSSTLYGRYGESDGVWIDPVTAAVMMVGPVCIGLSDMLASNSEKTISRATVPQQRSGSFVGNATNWNQASAAATGI